MLQLLCGMIIGMILNGCGVDTSSSVSDIPIVIPQSDNNNTNPSQDNGGGQVQNNPSENNTTNTQNNTTDASPCGNKCIFDEVNAIYDQDACNPARYAVAKDASYSGDKEGENGSAFYIVAKDGLQLQSLYEVGDVQDLPKTWVWLYYKPFPSPNDLNQQGSTTYTMDGVFRLSYDVAWSDTSIAGVDRVVYVRSDQFDKPYCYQLTLDNVVGTKIKVQKVFR